MTLNRFSESGVFFPDRDGSLDIVCLGVYRLLVFGVKIKDRKTRVRDIIVRTNRFASDMEGFGKNENILALYRPNANANLVTVFLAESIVLYRGRIRAFRSFWFDILEGIVSGHLARRQEQKDVSGRGKSEIGFSDPEGNGLAALRREDDLVLPVDLNGT